MVCWRVTVGVSLKPRVCVLEGKYVESLSPPAVEVFRHGNLLGTRSQCEDRHWQPTYALVLTPKTAVHGRQGDGKEPEAMSRQRKPELVQTIFTYVLTNRIEARGAVTCGHLSRTWWQIWGDPSAPSGCLSGAWWPCDSLCGKMSNAQQATNPDLINLTRLQYILGFAIEVSHYRAVLRHALLRDVSRNWLRLTYLP